jgi:hypothetical protein
MKRRSCLNSKGRAVKKTKIMWEGEEGKRRNWFIINNKGKGRGETKRH